MMQLLVQDIEFRSLPVTMNIDYQGDKDSMNQCPNSGL